MTTFDDNHAQAFSDSLLAHVNALSDHFAAQSEEAFQQAMDDFMQALGLTLGAILYDMAPGHTSQRILQFLTLMMAGVALREEQRADADEDDGEDGATP